jgi:hypothetical protein
MFTYEHPKSSYLIISGPLWVAPSLAIRLLSVQHSTTGPMTAFASLVFAATLI